MLALAYHPILGYDNEPTPDDVARRPSHALDDAQEDLLRQIASGRSTGLSLREDDIADELGLLDLVVSVRGQRYATRKGFAAVGLRRLVPAPGRHRVARVVRRG
jgi:hypothetical protein